MIFADRLEKVMALAEILPRYKQDLMRLAAKNLQFTFKDTAYEVDITVQRLKLFDHTEIFLANRGPLGGPGSSVAVMLSYNGSAWLNTVIASIFIVGNKVLAKFSSRGDELMALTEQMYAPIFGQDITFYRGDGRSFIKDSLDNPEVSAVIVFGFDTNILPYEKDFRRTGKKFVFEGPGVDPFIVLPDAALDKVFEDLMDAKFSYSGQTCSAPKRIFIHRDIYDEFLKQFVARVRKLKVGNPEDPETQISPVGSDLAVNRIKTQLQDAVSKKAQILTGGQIEGNLIFPTVLRDATDDMAGMQEEVFGPVAFTSAFDSIPEVIARSQNHRYGLRAAIFGGPEAKQVAQALRGEKYCHPVPDYTLGKFGTVVVNAPRAETWVGSLVTKPIGGYGYSGWIWETVDGQFRLKQGPKLFSLETSTPLE